MFDLDEENFKLLEPAINQEFYSEKEDYTMKEDDLGMFLYIKLNEINFNFSEFFEKQEKLFEEKEDKEISIKTEEGNSNSSKIAEEPIRKSNIQRVKTDDFNNQIQSKSNLILNKLKKVRERAMKANDKESLEDLQWIIKTMSENNLDEPEIKITLSEPLIKEERNPVEDYLLNYSRRESILIKQSDFAKIKSRKSSQTNVIG